MRIGKKTRAKIKKGCEGAVTLFLCIMMTPFLTLASALVEFSRYQQTAELVNELMDCSSLSVLANFDKYLEERFGLFGISQSCNINETYNKSITANSKLLGGNITLGGNISANGTLPLSEHNVLKTQLMDYSESTVLSEILLEDLKIKELLEKIDNLSAIKRISNVATAVGDLSGSVKDVVVSGKSLLDKIDAAKKKVTTFIDNLKSFCASLKSLVQEFTSEDEITFDIVKKNYLNKVKDIYEHARGLIDDGKAIIGDVRGIKPAFNDLKAKLQKAKTDLGKSKDAVVSVSNEAKSEGSGQEGDNLKKTGDSSNNTYDKIISDIENALTSAGEETINKIAEEFTKAADELFETLKTELGAIVDRTKGDIEYYFTGELTEELSSFAEKDLNTIVNILKELYTEYKSDSVNGILNCIKKKLPPCFFNSDLSQLYDILKGAIEEAGKTLENNVNEAADNIIGKLIDTIGYLFNLDVFYNPDLNTYLSDGALKKTEPDNPYVKLLSAISRFIAAGKNFMKAISPNSDLGPIERVIKLFESVGNLIVGVKEVIESIILAANTMLKLISELMDYITSGNWQGLYERLLLSGYMVHNLPNRTMADYDRKAGKVVIEGKSLTGFPYSNIEIPHGNAGESADGAKGLKGLSNFLDQHSSTTTENQEMFKGAELEFIAVGTQSEIMNQVASFMQLYMLRLLLDVIPVLTNGDVANMAASASIASWAVYVIVILAEPLCDTVLLVNSSETEIPFYKTTCFLTLNGLKNFAQQLAAATDSSLFADYLAKNVGAPADHGTGVFNMNYKSLFLLILMFTVPTENMLIRAENLIGLETAYHYKQKGADFTFALDNAYSSVETETETQLNSFIDIFKSSGETSAVKSVLKRTKGY